MAMHLFVLLCCGCAMVTLNLPNPNLMMVAASFGFGILVLAQIFGPLSSAHINCAVSFGLFCAGRTSLVRTFCYTLSQMIGSVFGALFLWAIFGTNWPAARAFGSNSYDVNVFTGGQVFFAEMLGTMLLMFNVLSTIDIPMEGGGPLGVYPIAMSVMIAHLFLLPIDGCSINPTRSFGPSLVAGWANIGGTYSNQQHIFWFGPMFGAGVAACLYEYASLKPANFAGAKDMDTALFDANKKKTKKKKEKKIRKDSISTNASNTVDDKTIHVVIDENPEKAAVSTASKTQPTKHVTMASSTSKAAPHAYAPVKSEVENKPKIVEIERKEAPTANATIDENDDDDELQEEALYEEDEDN